MLLSITILVFSFLLCSAYGVAFVGFISRKYRLQSSENIFLTVVSGMMLMSMLVRLLHFMLPATGITTGFLWLVGLVLMWIAKKDYEVFLRKIKNQFAEFAIPAKILLLLILISVIYNFLSRNNGFDTGAYHLQAIQWFEKYKVVPGLGNLIEQISFNSQWFLLQAALSFSFFDVPSIYLLNVLLCILFVFDLLQALIKKRSKWNLFRLLVLLYLPFMLFGKAVSSPTPDIPVTLLTIYLLLYVLENHYSIWQSTDAFLLVLLPVFLVSIKLSALPMLLLSLLVLFSRFISWRKVFSPIFFIGSLILIPWAVSTFIQSGYWVFPLKATAFPKTEWSVPDKVTNRVHVEIKGWARAPFIDFKTNGTNSPIALLEKWKTKLTGMQSGDYVDIEKVANMPFNEWLPIWFQRLNVVNLALVLFTCFTGGFLLFIVLLKRKQVYQVWARQKIVIGAYSVITTGLLFWFVNAPDLRFSHGVILPFIGANITIGIYLWKGSVEIRKILAPLFLTLSMVMCAGNYLFFKSFYPEHLVTKTLIKPLPYTTPLLEAKQIPGGVVQVSVYPQKCWDAPLPCTCIFYEGLQYRGSALEDGFVIKE